MAERTRRRRWLWMLLPLAALIGFFVLRALLQPERVSAFLLRQAEQATGLSLSLQQPADIGIWPDLHLELIGLTATAPGATTPLLRVRVVEVALPWSALRSDTIQLQRLRLIEPALDLPALQTWLAADDDSGPPAPLRMPQFDAAIEVEAGSIAGDGWAMDNLALRLPALRNGVATSLTASGSLSTASDVQAFELQLDTTPTLADFDIALKPLSLQISSTLLRDVRVQLDGELHYSVPDALRFGVAAAFDPWPAAWPALPFPPTVMGTEALPTATAPVSIPATSIRVDFAGRTDMQGDLDLVVTRGADTIAAQLQLGDLFAWLDAADGTTLPPLTGNITAPRLRLDGIDATGVTLRIDDNAAPAADPKP